MKLKNAVRFALIICAASILFTAAAVASPYTESLAGGKLRERLTVGLLISEENAEYSMNLWSLFLAWYEDGYLTEYVFNSENTEGMWEEAAKLINNMNKTQLILDPKCYNLSNMSDDEKERLLTNTELDLLLTMGTDGGRFMKQNDAGFDYMVMSCDDPVAEKIVDSRENPGEKGWAMICPELFKAQMATVRNTLNFESVSLIYDPNEEVSHIIDAIRTYTRQNAIELREYIVKLPSGHADYQRYLDDMLVAAKKAAQDSQCFLLTHNHLALEDYGKLFEPFFDEKVPIVSQIGETPVKYGAMMSVTANDSYNAGHFISNAIILYLNGVPLNKIDQVFYSSPCVAYNFAAAETIGYKFDYKTLLTADQIYITIR